MAAETLGDVLRRIGRLAGLQGVLSLTDAQLLERFAASRDEPAFAALMVRHGPMVLGVCRRLLHDADAAEDAFQAAFLVLARKAGAIQRRPLLSAWLYGVTYKVAARLRGRAWKRQARETSGADLASLAANIDPEPSDLPPLLHQEVQRLPDKYRNPIVLCYLEGKTHEEAAVLLRWPLGTVKTRLIKARGLLRSQLTRRGVTATEGMAATALAVNPMTAPARLTDATIRAATRFAVGDGGVSKLATARAIALSQGVLRTMILTKVKIAAALVLTVTMLGGAGGWLAYHAPGAVAAADASVAKADDKSNDDKDAIQGTWKVTGLERDGKDMTNKDEVKDVTSAKWTIAADKITVAVPKQDKHDVTYKLDPTKKPKRIDFTPLDGPPNEKGKTGHGIYSLEGDVLKLCMPEAPDADERPTELATKEGGKAILFTLKREKPAKAKPKENKPEADKQAIRGVWQVTNVESNNENFAGKPEAFKKIRTQQWVFTTDQVVVRMGGEKEQPAGYALDSSKDPKEIDVRPQKGEPMQGIYSLAGNGLKVCLPGPGNGPRPTELAVDEAGKNVLLTLERVSPMEEPKEAKPADNAKMKKLLQDLVNSANEEYRMRKQIFQEGHSNVESLTGAAHRVLTAELERSDNKEERVKACEAYLQQVTEVARLAKIQLQAGALAPPDAAEAEYNRLEAEIMLEREKAK